MGILKFLKQFVPLFFSTSTIHGFPYLIKRKSHPLEKIIWFLLLAGATCGVVIFSHLTLTRYMENPTVITIERDYFSWNTSFPAVTLCPTDNLDGKLLDHFIDKSEEKNKTVLREFLTALSSANYHNFDQIPIYDGLNENRFMQVLLELQTPFEALVTNTGTDTYKYNFHQTITEMGICYSFNSNTAKWHLETNYDLLLINPSDGEIKTSASNMLSSYDLYIHGPNELADISSKKIAARSDRLVGLSFSAMTIFSNRNLKLLSIHQRQCRFGDESKLKHSPIYSYVSCRIECRISLAKRLCKCIPHFYKQLAGDERVCDVSGLHCLAQYKERLINLKNECKCLPNCDETNYVLDQEFRADNLIGYSLNWGLTNYPKMRLRRDVIFGFTDFMGDFTTTVSVYIGGMAGLFLGCSVLSFIEIIYFFTLRLYWFVKSKF